MGANEVLLPGVLKATLEIHPPPSSWVALRNSSWPFLTLSLRPQNVLSPAILPGCRSTGLSDAALCQHVFLFGLLTINRTKHHSDVTSWTANRANDQLRLLFS